MINLLEFLICILFIFQMQVRTLMSSFDSSNCSRCVRVPSTTFSLVLWKNFRNIFSGNTLSLILFYVCYDSLKNKSILLFLLFSKYFLFCHCQVNISIFFLFFNKLSRQWCLFSYNFSKCLLMYLKWLFLFVEFVLN